MIPGDGVGPELMTSVDLVFKAAGVPVKFEEVNLPEITHHHDAKHFNDVVNSVRKNKVVLMGHIVAGQTASVQETWCDLLFLNII